MIKRWIPTDMIVDNFIDIDDGLKTGDFDIDTLRRITTKTAYHLFSRTTQTLYPEIKTGTVKDNRIELPEGWCKHEALYIDGNKVAVTMQQLLMAKGINKNQDSISSYKAKIMGTTIMFNVVGGTTDGVNGKQYSLEYYTVPLVDETLFVPEQFENAIHATLKLIKMQKRIERSGRGEGLLAQYRKTAQSAEDLAVINVEFPSKEQLMLIGKIWESKVPKNLEYGNQNNFTNT